MSSCDVRIILKIIRNNKSLQLLDLEENDFSIDDEEYINKKIQKNSKLVITCIFLFYINIKQLVKNVSQLFIQNH